jgi:hypothetical protein
MWSACIRCEIQLVCDIVDARLSLDSIVIIVSEAFKCNAYNNSITAMKQKMKELTVLEEHNLKDGQ